MGISNETSDELWNSFIAGGTCGFKQLFQSYFDQMYAYGNKLCDDPELVKDCIQDLFKTLWERRHELDHIDSPRVYLFVSLRRRILKKVEKKRKKDGNLDEVDNGAFLDFSKQELIIRNENKFKQKEKLKEALNRLTNRQKEVVYLHYFNGMSYDEIQHILSINKQSVYNHMHRAIENLRGILDNEIMKLVISLMIAFLYSFAFV